MRFIKFYLLIFALINTTYAAKITDPVLSVGKDAATDFTILHKDGGYIKKTGSQGDWLFSTDGVLEKKIGSGSGSGGSGGVNLLLNNSFEDGLTNWTTSGGTLTQETYTNGTEGDLKYARFVSTVAGQYVESDCYDKPDNFDVGGMANIKFKDGSGNFELKIFDCVAADIEVSSASLADISTWLKSPTQVYPTPLKVKIRLVSTAAGTIDFDSVYTGSNQGFISGTYTNSVNLEGNDGRVITGGTEDTYFNGSGTGWSSSGDDHKYTVQRTGSIIEIKTSVKVTANNTNRLILYKNNTAYRHIGNQSPSTVNYFQGNYVSYKGEFLAGDLLSIRMVSTGTLENPNVERHYLNILEKSDESQEAFVPEQAGFYIDVSIGGALVSTSSNASPTIPSNGSLDMVLNKGSAQIACNGAASTGLTCSGVNETLGLSFNAPRVGDYKVCYTFTNNANGSTAFRIVETELATNTIIQTSKAVVNPSTADQSATRLCARMSFASIGEKVLKLAYESNNTGSIYADRSASFYERDVNITVDMVRHETSRPVIQNMVDTSYKAGKRIESCYMDASGGTPTSGSLLCNDWVSSYDDDGVGEWVVNIQTGIFNTPPVCVATYNTGNGSSGFDRSCQVLQNSATSFDLSCRQSNALADARVTFICTGGR